MASETALVEAVRAAIVASAYLSTYERVSAAAEACVRLGRLTSGRWRSVARELDRTEEDLERALDEAGSDLARRAKTLELEEETLWTAGDAAGIFDLFREDARDALEEGSLGARLLEGDLLFGATFLEDPDVPNRGTTLLFGWADPLFPATWSWEGNWVASDDEEEPEELDLSEVSGLQVGEQLVAETARFLETTPERAERALTDLAAALTRVSLLAALEEDDDDEDEAEQDEADSSNGHR